MVAAYYMDAEITPACSLSKRGLAVVMGITIVLAAVPVIAFTVMGAYLVAPFVGLDVLALWYAFHVMNRRVEAERVRVSAEQVEVLRGARRVWTSATAFTRVEPGETSVGLTQSGRRVRVAQALSPTERNAFADALDEAIRAARRERYPG